MHSDRSGRHCRGELTELDEHLGGCTSRRLDASRVRRPNQCSSCCFSAARVSVFAIDSNSAVWGFATPPLQDFSRCAAVACYQTANLVTAALSTQAGSAAKILGYDGRGYTAFFYAQTLSFVASAVATASLANVLLQRLSKHYAEGDDKTASRELNDAILAIGALLIPVASIFISLGPLGAELLFTRGETDRGAAHFIGVVLALLAVGLVPHALHELLIRPFYAIHDAKTPLRSAAIVAIVWILGSISASLFLPPEYALLGIAGAVSLAYIVDLPLRLRSLNKRLQFRISSRVIRGYATALSAAVCASVIVGVSSMYIERNIPQHWFPRTILFLGGAAGIVIIYYPLTARSSASAPAAGAVAQDMRRGVSAMSPKPPRKHVPGHLEQLIEQRPTAHTSAP